MTPYNDEEGSYFKVYVADTGLMFYKFGIDPTAFLDETMRLNLSSEFRGALAENFVMQSLAANEVHTYYWMPTDKVGNGEVDFVFQDRLARVIPVEVKSARNVKAKSLQKFMREGGAPYAIRLSESNFGREPMENAEGVLLSLPLYAAFCISPTVELGGA